jgi:uncharacterized protein YndB with AHSA1/START domain
MPKQERNIITDKLVVQKTGSTLEHWFSKLDSMGAKKLSHANIYKLASSIEEIQMLGEWNLNLLATCYEWSRGLKERGQKEDGFEISVSKTVSVPVEVLYETFTDIKLREKWLKEKIEIRKSTENKSARITWLADGTSLSIDFYKKSEEKSQVVVQHQKLTTREKADEAKDFWAGKLDDLKKLLEKNG